jgi:hypothetical protein
MKTMEVKSMADDIFNDVQRSLDGSSVTGMLTGEDFSDNISETESDILDARTYLGLQQLRRAKKRIRKAEHRLGTLEEDVLQLRKNIAMVHRILAHKNISLDEAELILHKLRDASSEAEKGKVDEAAMDVEDLLESLIGGNSSTLNPFLFRHFWMGVRTVWPAGGDAGYLLIRIINDGPIPLPMLRMAPPLPEGWTSTPASVDLPIIGPGGNVPIRFEIRPDGRSSEEIPLSRKLAITTAYEMRSGEITVTIQAQNRSLEPLSDVLIQPWLPPGFTAEEIPFIPRLQPDEMATLRFPLSIHLGRGGAA